ncbi:MAG: hypothetical protein JRI96_12130 [Deltaproteobacteria bacterium]|nr:hypothetical protein [Deltaproteobacteria bacterium]
MNKISKFIKTNWALLLILILIVSVCLVNKKYLTISSSSDLILFITFLALLWYTYETRKTRLNSEKQIELSLTPVISLELIENQAAGYNFKLKNVGPGLARDIKITNNTVVCRNNAYPLKDNEEKMANPKFNIPCFLYSGEEKILTPLQKGEQDLWIIKKSGLIQIECKNLEGKKDSRKFAIKERCKDEKNWTYWQIEVED